MKRRGARANLPAGVGLRRQRARQPQRAVRALLPGLGRAQLSDGAGARAQGARATAWSMASSECCRRRWTSSEPEGGKSICPRRFADEHHENRRSGRIDRSLHRRQARRVEADVSRSARRSTASISPTSAPAVPRKSTRPWPPRVAHFRMGGARTRRTPSHPETLRAGDPRSREGARRGRDRRQRIAADGQPRARDSARRSEHRVLRRPRAEVGSRANRFARSRQSRALRSGRSRGADHAVERPLHADDVEGRAGARGGRHRRRQAARMGAAHLLDDGGSRHRGRHPRGRPQRRAGNRRRSGRRARGASRYRPVELHRLDRHREVDRAVHRALAHSRQLRARRQVSLYRLRRRRPRRRRADRRRPVHQRGPGLPCGHAAAG